MAARGGPLPHLPRRGAESGCRPRLGTAPGRGRRRLRTALRSDLLRAAGVEQRVRLRRTQGRTPHAPRPLRRRPRRRPRRVVRRDDPRPLAPPLQRRARPGGGRAGRRTRTFELSQYLVDELDWRPPAPAVRAEVAYHDSCHMLRELRLRDQPRTLLAAVATLQELPRADRCCGFGGTFSVRLPRRVDRDGRRQAGLGRRRLGGRCGERRPGVRDADRGPCLAGPSRRQGRPPRDRRRRGAMSGFESRAAAALADPHKRANVPRFAERAADNRVRGLGGVDFEALRTAGEAARSRAIADLPALLDSLQERLEAAGAVVHRAPTGADAAAYVTDVVLRHGRMAVKGKSMAAEEIGLNERLEAAGSRSSRPTSASSSSRLAGETPEHIITPAIHHDRYTCADLFAADGGAPRRRRPGAELAAFARGPAARAASSTRRRRRHRRQLRGRRDRFDRASSTNEGNGRMCTSRALRCTSRSWGWSASSPTWPSWRAARRSSPAPRTGQKLTSYSRLINGPRRADERATGPRRSTSSILDNGRSRVLGRRRTGARSHCIRCGACLNACPVYRQVGGPRVRVGVRRADRRRPHAAPAPGPGGRELADASSLCAACDDVCPVSIPLHELLLELRRDRAADSAGLLERLAFRLWSFAWSRPRLFRLTVRLAGRARGPLPLLRRWTADARPRGAQVIDEFTRELEAVGGHVHHGRAALEELAGEGVSVTPCLALIAETGQRSSRPGSRPAAAGGWSTLCTSSRRLPGSSSPTSRPRFGSSAPSWRRRRRSRSSRGRAARPTSSRT